MFRPTIIVSGLTAAGKTTHAKALAELLDVPFFSASALSLIRNSGHRARDLQ